MKSYDRDMEDVGNLIALEHVNVTVPDQRLATLFYVVGMGFTRDPYLSVGDENMWINLGHQQFHLPTRGPQVLRGHVGIVVPDLGALVTRLNGVRDKLAGTRFGYAEGEGSLTVSCPWGNELRCYAPQPRFGDMTLGMPYVAGPASIMSIVLLTENDLHSIPQQACTLISLCIVLSVTYLVLRAASPLQKLLGGTGINVLGRIMGLVLASLAVQALITGLRNVFFMAH